MTILGRRDFLRLGLAGLALPGLANLAFAAPDAAQPPRLLVLLHLRGGMDGLNLVSPANDPDLIAARASELRVAEEGFPLAGGMAPGIDFRLHAAAPALAELYNAGHLAVIHATGLPIPNRSHFVAIDMMDRGVADTGALLRTETGWLARSGRGTAAGSEAALVTIGATPAGEFLGLRDALALPDLSNGAAPAGGPQVAAVLGSLYGPESGPSSTAVAGRDALTALAAVDRRVPRDASGKPQPYQPPAGVNYAPAGELARPLQVLAQLIRMEVGLTTATLELGGWDTHEGQAGRFRNQTAKLSAGLGALWQDLGDWRDRVVLVAFTEFGRRLRSNKSGGTDHGRGGVALVLGGGVAGGRVLGRWPGLATEQLDEHVDLAVTTDYRQVLAEALAQADGRTPRQSPFPGFVAAAPLGLFHNV